MKLVKSASLPTDCLLVKFSTAKGGYGDCYFVDVPGDGDLETYIRTFFDTWVFRLELRILTLVGRHSGDQGQVKRLAAGETNEFAVWRVEARTPTELLMVVGKGPIRTWLHIQPTSGRKHQTRLYFGSGVLPVAQDRHGAPRLDVMTRVFMPLHKIYSRILLQAAARKWSRA